MIKADVKIIKADLSYLKFIYLLPLSDFHWDEPQSDHEAIRGYVDWVRDHENARVVLVGDLFSLIAQRAAYRDVYEKGEPGELIELMPPDKTIDELEELLSPIANKILAACTGGHELNNMFSVVGVDYTFQLMKRLKIEERYARDGGALLIKTEPLASYDDTFFIAVFTHGWGSARTRGAKIRKLEYIAQGFECDMVIMAHDHTQNLTRDNRLTFPTWGVEHPQVHRVLLVSSGAFRGYAGYPFRSGYQPSDLGTPRIRIGKRIDKNGVIKKDIHASI